jgi:hypothetical protein
MRYYDLKKHWSKKVVPHLGDPELNKVLVRDFNKFTFGRWRKRFEPGMYPEQFDGCEWRLSQRGPQPRYWRYVAHSACHWLVNFALRLARLVEPDRPWRIVSSDRHSTVWDGEDLLFDLQFSALGVPPEKCREAVREGEALPPGKYLKVYRARHWKTEMAPGGGW